MEENRLYETPGEGFSLCVWVRERLPDLIEGYLESMVAEAVRAHLAACYLCAKEYNEMERTIKLIETLPFVEMEKDLTPTIMAALEEQSGYSFQTPVVEVETKDSIAVSAAVWPRTTTGQQRPILSPLSALLSTLRRALPVPDLRAAGAHGGMALCA